MDFSALFLKMGIFCTLLLTGYAAARTGKLTKEFSKSASWLIVNIFMVASIINSVINNTLTISRNDMWKALLLMTVEFVVLYAIGTVAMHFDGKKTAPITLIMIGAMNNLFIGVPVLQSVYGDAPVFYMGLSCIPFNLVLYSYGVWHLTKGKDGDRITLKKMIGAPLVASIAALVIFVSGVKMPRLVTELFGTVATSTVPVSMIVIGAALGGTKIEEAVRNKKLYILSFVKLIILPIAVYLVVKPFTADEVFLASCVVMAGCPAAAVCTPLAIQYGYDAEYTSEFTLITTAFSMLTLPCVLYVLSMV